MTDPDNLEQVSLADFFLPLVGHGRLIWRGTLIMALVAMLGGGAYFFLQPTTRSAWLQFRPLFKGADEGKYPNDLPFSPMDIVSPSVVGQVWAKNDIQKYCPGDKFLSGFAVQESSPELQFLNLQYQARLADNRLTAIDRQRLQEEYTSRRATLQPQYELLFIQPSGCAVLPQPIVFKSLVEIIETWAIDAEEKRGVMKVRVPILTPAIFDQADAPSETALIRADLLRNAVARVVANITAVENLPGSELVRGSDKKISFAEVRAELEDLMQARLNPVVALAGGGLGRQATRWVEQALQTATTRYRAAEQRAEAYRQALREYSGIAATPKEGPGTPSERPQPSRDVQGLTTQIDSAFIDRIVQLSAANTTFRQEITRRAIEASFAAVEQGAVVEQYRQLLTWLGQGDRENAAADAVNQALNRISTQARDATRRFNEIYSEFSRLSLSNGSALYRIEQPPQAQTIRAFGLRAFALVLAGVVIATPVVLAIAILLQHHVRRLVHSMR
jgi:hypothetical protein